VSGTLELACGGSLQYLRHTAAMIASVIEHSGGLSVRVHYLHDPRLSAADARKLAGWIGECGAEPILIPVARERLAGLPGRSYLPPAMWHRVFLPELAPDLPRVLYLDADVIAMDSLAPLWATDLGDRVIAAVTNIPDPWTAPYFDALGLEGPYFNSGVMLVDLDRMRAERLQERILAARTDEMRFGDQDPLNVVLGSARLELDPRWNVMNSFWVYRDAAAGVFGREALESALARPGIRHFEGPSVNKPWHLLCERPFAHEYFRQRAATPWPRVRREGITPRNVARRARQALTASRQA